MRLILKHILRNIYKDKLKSIMIVFSLALSTLILFLNLTNKDDIVVKYESILRSTYQDFDLRITKKGENGESSFKKADLDLSDSSIIDRIFFKSTDAIYKKNDQVYPISILGADINQLIENKLILINDSCDFIDYSIIISQRTSNKYQLKIGDSIEVLTNDGPIQLKVYAIANNSRLFQNESMASFFIVTENTLNTEGYNFAFINIKKDAEINQVKDIINEINPDFQVESLYNTEELNFSISMVSSILIIILLIVIVLNIYVISSLTERIIAERIPVLGTFRSIGASKKKVEFILILENAVYGLIGGLIGILIGSFTREPMTDIFLTIESDKTTKALNLPFRLEYIIFSILFCVILQILISFKSIRKISKMDIKDIIFNTIHRELYISNKQTLIGFCLIILGLCLNLVNFRYNLLLSSLSFIIVIVGAVLVLPQLIKFFSIISSKLLNKFISSSAGFGIKHLASSKSVSSSIRLVSISIALMIMIYMAVLSLDDTFTKVYEQSEYDIIITNIDKTEEAYQNLDKIEGVKSVYFQYHTTDYHIKGIKSSLIVVGENKPSVLIKGKTSDFNNLKENKALIDEYFALKHNIQLSDSITLSNKDNEELNYIITGFIDSSIFTISRNVLVISKETYISQIDNKPTVISIATEDDVNLIKHRLMEAMVGNKVSIISVSEMLETQKKDIDGVISMVQLMMGLSIVFAAIGMVNNQLVAFIQRKKELAVLYSIALSKAQLRIMILAESIGTFLLGCLFGGLLGTILVPILERSLYAIGIVYDVTIDATALLSMIGLVFIALSITAISPMIKVGKLDIVSEIKYE